MGFDPDAFWRQTPRLILLTFEARGRAAETERRKSLWLAREQANLIAFAHHAPAKMPTLAKLLGGETERQSGHARRQMMKAFVAARGGKVTKKEGR